MKITPVLGSQITYVQWVTSKNHPMQQLLKWLFADDVFAFQAIKIREISASLLSYPYIKSLESSPVHIGITVNSASDVAKRATEWALGYGYEIGLEPVPGNKIFLSLPGATKIELVSNSNCKLPELNHYAIPVKRLILAESVFRAIGWEIEEQEVSGPWGKAIFANIPRIAVQRLQLTYLEDTRYELPKEMSLALFLTLRADSSAGKTPVETLSKWTETQIGHKLYVDENASWRFQIPGAFLQWIDTK
jgi:hypothetical protein